MCATGRQQVGAVPPRNALPQPTSVAVGVVVNPGWLPVEGHSSTDWAWWATATAIAAQYVALFGPFIWKAIGVAADAADQIESIRA